MIDVHQNLGFVETFFCRGSRVTDNRCNMMDYQFGFRSSHSTTRSFFLDSFD